MKKIAIVGAGIAGLMCAYVIRQKDKESVVDIFEDGNPVDKRVCPSIKYNKPCANCNVCNITKGDGGSGAFSDGKFNIGTAYGGTLGDEVGQCLAMEYIEKVKDVMIDFFKIDKHNNANNEPIIYKPNTDLCNLCSNHGTELLNMEVIHFGTENNKNILRHLTDYLVNNNVSFRREKVMRIIKKTVITKNQSSYEYDYIVVSVGRNGAELVQKCCNENGISMMQKPADIGVRVEMKNDVWKYFSDRIYEPKIRYTSNRTGDSIRTFCFNPNGFVVSENNNGVITANGHRIDDGFNSSKENKSENCNFAILTSIDLQGANPNDYVTDIARIANKMTKYVPVQRFGDFTSLYATTEVGLSQNSVRPTLKAIPYDLNLFMPRRIIADIVDFMFVLDDISHGNALNDNLIYGPEIKRYGSCPKHNKNFEIYDGVFLIGDCSGISHGLSQAGAMGYITGENIIL